MDFTTARLAMVDCQVRPSDVTRFDIIDAMLSVPREAYVPNELRSVAYSGEHVPLGGGRVLLDPRVIGKFLDAVAPGPGDLVLDIGTGLGYSAALLARLSQAVVAVEEDEAMARAAEATLSDHGVDNVMVVNAPHTDGAPEHGPYDVIFLQGAFETFPKSLENQLKEDGRVVALRLDGAVSYCTTGVKSGGRITWRHEFDATGPLLEGFETAKEFTFG